MAVVKKNDIDKLLDGISIPSPPQVFADLEMEMAMPEPCLASLAQIIANDVGLCGAVLKTINSPLFGGGKEATSIKQAVMTLGMQNIMDIVNTVSLRNATINFDKMTDRAYATLTRFWDSATDVAKVCDLVAAKLSISPLENVYLLGLFHNVGMALLIAKYDNYLDIIENSYDRSSGRIVDVENDAFDTNHAVIGYYTARSWKLENRLCKIISIHHNTSVFKSKNVADTSENILLGVLKIAEHIVGLYRVLGNQSIDHEWEKIGENILVSVGLTHYEMDDLVAQASDAGYGRQLYFR